jgi:ElaB/YqjD/DUF883 family membrane-anchored ribosome-binding protein
MNDFTRDVRDQVRTLEHSLARGTTKAADTAVEYAREHPWRLAGAAVALAALSAMLLRGMRGMRR